MAAAVLDDDVSAPADPFEVPKGFEMVDGELTEMPPMGFASSYVASRLHGRLDRWCDDTAAGVAMTADSSFRCFPHKPTQVRKPDVAVILCDPATFVTPRVNCATVPDLVVEVISPSDEAMNINARVRDFLLAGTKLVWVIDPDARLAAIYRPDRTAGQVWEGEDLSGEGVLPGFRVPLTKVLPILDPTVPAA